ncbi:sporulation integral membrane protein YtvI [Syntrophobotulus glycolicus DSM 8271]|uniref:Sporulation integral membrane protein YtvI n=1 Tax=Syntrophobotulus glycolicus (strain DSM 8271 / FlGlyR) TaxID=645991 RepID=F0SUA0_SYNGF|nr:sporulation integral membrane protein YtvI [Syntrophobotulus glycolicus]ADY56550.1 sporulation integral membrane protein YtvI [Syntrophobotulus glycolicus DSM 8271]
MADVSKKSTLIRNLNLLIKIAAILLALKLFTYTFVDFLPVLGSVLSRLFSAFSPFILGIIFAFLMEPLVQKLCRNFRIKRVYSSILALSCIVFLMILLMIIAGNRLYHELADLTAAFPGLYENNMAFVGNQIDNIEKYIRLNPEIQNALKSSSQEIFSYAQVAVKNGSIGLLNILGSLPGFLVVIMVLVVSTLLTSISYPAVKEWFFRRFKEPLASKTRIVAAELGSALIGFLRAESILLSVTSLVVITGLLIIGNEYAFTLGLLTGLMDLLPVIGPGVIFIPWAIIVFISSGIGPALKILAVYAAATVIRQILEPKIMSHNIGLHPLPTLISMYVGLNLLGAAGIILGPTVIVIYEACRKAGLFNRKE